MDLPIYKIKKTIANYPTSKVNEEHLFEFEIFLFNDFPKIATRNEDLELFTNGEIYNSNINVNFINNKEKNHS